MPLARGATYPPAGMLGPRAIAWWALRTQTGGVRVEGLENVPDEGGVLLVARHYHHLLDGAVLIGRVPRPVHVVVGLDWTANARQRRRMERACAWAQWPVILRPRTTAGGGYDPSEVARYLRSGLRHAAELLAAGRVVAMFPEGYPVVDPTPGGAAPRGRDADGMLPFASGFRTIARLANGRGARLAIVPVGFAYERDGARWRITARFGAPLPPDADVVTVERAVRELSGPMRAHPSTSSG
jgi:1-acyl-sn-glycerol-3-phosphate acyltransferase